VNFALPSVPIGLLNDFSIGFFAKITISGIFIFTLSTYYEAPNGLRYPLVGGTRQRRFDGTRLEPRKLPENAATPTSRVHAVLGALLECQPGPLEQDTLANLKNYCTLLELSQLTKSITYQNTCLAEARAS